LYEEDDLDQPHIAEAPSCAVEAVVAIDANRVVIGPRSRMRGRSHEGDLCRRERFSTEVDPATGGKRCMGICLGMKERSFGRVGECRRMRILEERSVVVAVTVSQSLDDDDLGIDEDASTEACSDNL
jgi:hypothetical protein